MDRDYRTSENASQANFAEHPSAAAENEREAERDNRVIKKDG